MANTITFEISKNKAKSFEKLLDETLKVLRRMEKESPKREARIAQSQVETQKLKEDIREQLAILNERNKRLDTI